MFEQLFEKPRAVAKQRAGPLAEERLRYLTHLAHQELARATLRTIAYYLLIVARSLRLEERPDEFITRTEIEQEAIRWAHRHPQPPKTQGPKRAQAFFLRCATQWLHFLGRLEQLPDPVRPHVEWISPFADYMSQERGLSSATIIARCSVLQDFFNCLGDSTETLHHITLARIDDVLTQKMAQGYVRVSVRTYAAHLRAFFLYAERRGWCRPGLAAGITAPRVFPQEGIPCGPSWEQVQQLLAASAGDQPSDIRDHALLMLLAIYGLRAGEVLRLRLQDLDWEREVLTVERSKGGQTHTYPLCRSVGDAILRYLREVRPRSAHRQVFLTRRPPFRPLSSSGLRNRVRPRLQALGVTLRHYGPHALRHACAGHLLNQGLTLKEIGDHLGHQHPEATSIYVKVDLTHLRQVADFDLGDLP